MRKRSEEKRAGAQIRSERSLDRLVLEIVRARREATRATRVKPTAIRDAGPSAAASVARTLVGRAGRILDSEGALQSRMSRARSADTAGGRRKSSRAIQWPLLTSFVAARSLR